MARYALRFLILLLTMETLIHVMHVVVIKDARALSAMTPAQLSMLGFWKRFTGLFTSEWAARSAYHIYHNLDNLSRSWLSPVVGPHPCDPTHRS